MSIIENGGAGYQRLKPVSLLQQSNYEAEDDIAYHKMRQLALCNQSNGLIQDKKRIIKAGQLGTHSACSVINPGTLYRDNEFLLLCRGEPDENVWLGDFLAYQPTPLWCTLDSDLNVKNSFPLSYQEFPSNSRPEDWRLFEYQGKLYTNHSIYMMLDRDEWIIRSRVGISEIDLPNQELKLRCILEPPFEPSHEEKNWSFFVHDSSLMCIYSFKPYILLELDLERGTTQKVLEAEPDYQWYEKGKFVGNSTNLTSWDNEHYITFIHDFLDPRYDQRNRAYMQYATLISKSTLLPASIIPRPLVIGGNELGRHPGVHYTSSLVNREDGLYSFYGEGDSHVGTVVFNKNELTELFNKYHLYDNKISTFGIMKDIDPKKGIIVSYPRSGLNWLRYCIEHLTGLRTGGRTKLIKKGELAVYRTHDVKVQDDNDECHCPFYDQQGKPLHKKIVLLLRDYRESFIRITKAKEIEIPAPEEIRNGNVFHFRDYFENLKAYDQFSGKKLLVRYPDLISDFSEVTKILDFFELPYELKKFDLEHHRQQSFQIYDNQHKSYTKDNPYDFNFHQNGVDSETIQAIEDFATKNYGDLVKRYLL